MPERQDVDHAGEPDMAGRPRRGGDQQIGRGNRCRRLQMVLEKPDLIDADAFGQLDLSELAPKHSICVEFSRWAVVDQMASRMV